MTYMHEGFIKDAMDGIMMQQTNFKVEVVVGDDFSDDRTLEIIRSYGDSENIHIKILKREKGDDYWRKRQELGRLYNFTDILENCTGKYIALLDGDDYWTHPHKLQKQIDFLEKNNDYSLCFTRAEMLKDNELTLHNVPFEKTTFTGIDFLNTYNFICTATVVFKREVLTIFNDQTKYPFADLALYLHASKIGKIKGLSDLTAVYRIHDSGLWSKLNSQAKLLKFLSFYKTYYPHATKAESSIITDRAYSLLLKLKKETPSSTYLYHIKLLFTHKMLNTKISSYLGYVLGEVKTKLTA